MDDFARAGLKAEVKGTNFDAESAVVQARGTKHQHDSFLNSDTGCFCSW